MGHAAIDDADADIDVLYAGALPSTGALPPPGAVRIAHYEDDRPRYDLWAVEGGYRYRFHGLLELQVSLGLDRVHVQLVYDADPLMTQVILSGNVIAALMLLRGWAVLHASAVELDGQAIAIMGNPGAGKSTLATLASARGARLVTDDVLRVAVDPSGQAICYRGADALRLRPASVVLAPLLRQLDDVSPDGRHLYAPQPTPRDRLPLRRIVIPGRGSPGSSLERRRLGAREALMALVGFPRVQNWQHPPTAGPIFQALAALAGAIPVDHLIIPAFTEARQVDAAMDALLAG